MASSCVGRFWNMANMITTLTVEMTGSNKRQAATEKSHNTVDNK